MPTLPFFFDTNQTSPEKSGSADVIRSVEASSTPVRSKSRFFTRDWPSADSAMTKM